MDQIVTFPLTSVIWIKSSCRPFCPAIFVLGGLKAVVSREATTGWNEQRERCMRKDKLVLFTVIMILGLLKFDFKMEDINNLNF